MQIDDKCIKPYGNHAVVTDEDRDIVIATLVCCWQEWDITTQVIYAYGTNIKTANPNEFRKELESRNNEGLADYLFDIWDNGDLIHTQPTPLQ